MTDRWKGHCPTKKASLQKYYFFLVSTAAAMYCSHARILGVHENSENFEEAERKRATSRRDQYLEMRRS